MAKTIPKQPVIVQVCDKYRDYYKIVPGFFWSHTEVIRTDRLENELTLTIECETFPNKVFINGKSYKLISEVTRYIV